MTDTPTGTEKVKKERTPEQQAQGAANRALARALARADGARGEGALKTRWTENRKKYVSEAKKISKALAKAGVTLNVGPKPERSKGAKDDSADD